MADVLTANAADLDNELAWLASMLELRLKDYFGEQKQDLILPRDGPEAPGLEESRSIYATLVRQHSLGARERLLTAIALAPYLRPQLLDVLFTCNEITKRPFTEFGGHTPTNAGGSTDAAFTPSVETALFLLAADDLGERLRAATLLEPGAHLIRMDLLQTFTAAVDAPPSATSLRPSARLLSALVRGKPHAPEHGDQFPARRVASGMQWDDLVLPEATLGQLLEIRNWLKHGHQLLHDWGMAKRIRPGFTSLFFGPPGTGKTLSACLLGKLCDCEVYKIDLSLVVSKYIGETEKNLSRVFDQAEARRWILFFDEADSLFGKRSQVNDSHDRYANQEVSFLLQRIEDFSGVVILASNMKANIDDAFLRRFQSVVHFPMPRVAERLRLWREAFPEMAALETGLDLARLAERYELSGGTIMNVSRHASLCALARGNATILVSDVDEGIRRELTKEGRAA